MLLHSSIEHKKIVNTSVADVKKFITPNPRKISRTESWGSSRFFIVKVVFFFHFDNFFDLGFETMVDGTTSGTVMVKRV